jgi:uncharacterized protein (TIGR02757 family)
MVDDLKDFLDKYVKKYNKPSFIETDPISIPHLFTDKKDREIAGFLVASIAWGQRKTILNNGQKLMVWMDHAPHDFLMNHTEKDLKPFSSFVHRTFNGDDALYFISALKKIYTEYPDMEAVFTEGMSRGNMFDAIVHFRNIFFADDHLRRTQKHVSNPDSGSAAKRLNMFLRWMVRKDKTGVDFGCWESISPEVLLCPLDVHSGRTARKLGLLTRTQDDRRAVEELTGSLRLLHLKDPVQYDFALYGLGVFEKF